MLVDIFINIIAGLIGAIVTFIAQRLYKGFTEKSSPLTGIWEACIYDKNGCVVKTDTVEIKQRGENIYGQIARVAPYKEINREWRFEGKVKDRQMITLFWSKSDGVQSYGCGFMTQASRDKFVGQYVSLQYTVDENGNFVGNITPTKGTIRRKALQKINKPGKQ